MMTDEQWARFAARVPAGTIVRAWGMQGLLIEHRNFKQEETHEGGLISIPCKLAWQPFTRFGGRYAFSDIQDFSFLIDNEWLSYRELMTLEEALP